jgi:glutamate dehydrogenase (NAD(P)+)
MDSFVNNSLLKEKGPGIKGKSVIVQGFGAVGYWAAKFLHKDEAKVVGIIEYNSAIYNPNGIDVDMAKNHFL